jgi:hypothetical protein
MKKSRILYQAIVDSKPPSELGLAIRDGLPLDKLKDESIAAVAVAVTLYERGLLKALEEASKVPDPPAGNGATAPTEAAPTVTPPTAKKPAATSPKA